MPWWDWNYFRQAAWIFLQKESALFYQDRHFLLNCSALHKIACFTAKGNLNLSVCSRRLCSLLCEFSEQYQPSGHSRPCHCLRHPERGGKIEADKNKQWQGGSICRKIH